MKITAIISTATAPFETLYWSINSLLLRTPRELLDQIIVSINGPDPRTGDMSLQDKKQKFLENLRESGLPITVVRTWSRLGFSQPYEICLSLVRTDLVLFMHDDVILLNNNWWKEIDGSIITAKPKFGGKLLPNIWMPEIKMMRMDFPYINSAFVVFDMSVVVTRWTNYYMNLEKPQNSKNWDVLREFFLIHKDAVSLMPDDNLHKNIAERSRMACFEDCYNYNLLTYPMGAWIYYESIAKDWEVSTFSSGTIDHLEAMSWKEGNFEEVTEPMPVVLDLIDEMKDKSGNYKIPNIDNVKPLVGVIAYNRIKTIDSWLRAWNNAEHYGSKIVVIHNFDCQLSDAEKVNITKHNPDFYVPRPNFGRDIGAFKDLVIGNIAVPCEWNVLVWFTDDVIPMRKDFLLPLLREISKPAVGLVGGWMDGNVRTICFAIKRDLAKKIMFVDDPFEMEHGAKNISKQICDMGFEVKLPTQRYSPKYAWDSDYEGIVDLWDKYESQF